MSAPFIAHEHGAWCHPAADGCPEEIPAPPLSRRELATLARFDVTEPAPESYVRQHRTADCWCNPTLIPGTLGTWQHNTPEES